MPFQTGLMIDSYSHLAALPMASHAACKPGHNVSRIQPHTASIAALMPSHAGFIAFSYSHTAPAAIASHAATIPGHSVFLIQSHTAAAAALIPAQTFSQTFWPTSV